MFPHKNNPTSLALFLLVVLFSVSCTDTTKPGADKAASTDSIPWSELNMAKDSAALLLAARSLMAADTNVAMITTDAEGRPRVRTVYPVIEEASANTISNQTRIWVMTRTSTRKVSQLQSDPRVTLYFNDDATERYASIMGVATVFTDHRAAEAAQFLNSKIDSGMIRFFWPAFPKDFVLIRIRPQWIEYLGKEGVTGDPETWRPQAVVFAR